MNLTACHDIDLAMRLVYRNSGNGPQVVKESGFRSSCAGRVPGLYQLRYTKVLLKREDFALYTRALAGLRIFKDCSRATYASIVRSGSISGHHTKTDLKRACVVAP